MGFPNKQAAEKAAENENVLTNGAQKERNPDQSTLSQRFRNRTVDGRIGPSPKEAVPALL
ncbi:MAG: hypothetical protein DHS20C11_21390 [Lysobacteraceae bacterium]|nr:MAG: hypothetical protein DHS20C11_21390 [Xanthomonadaceae bacterium]